MNCRDESVKLGVGKRRGQHTAMNPAASDLDALPPLRVNGRRDEASGGRQRIRVRSKKRSEVLGACSNVVAASRPAQMLRGGQTVVFVHVVLYL